MDERQAVNFHAGAGRGWDLAAPRSRGWETPGILSPPPTCQNTSAPLEAWKPVSPRATSWWGDPGWEHPRLLSARKVGVGVPVLAPPPSLVLLRTESPYQKVP